MMMLSSTEAVSSARAADIISDLRNIKTAVLAWYADNLDKIDAKGYIKIKGKSNFIQKQTLNLAWVNTSMVKLSCKPK